MAAPRAPDVAGFSVHAPPSGATPPRLPAGRLDRCTDGGLGNALVTVNRPYLQGSLGVYAAETAWLPGAIARLREQLAINEERRAQAAETLRIARNRYRNGYASYLEELDAQRTLYAADVARLQLKARLLVATVDLYRALGGGWGA